MTQSEEARKEAWRSAAWSSAIDMIVGGLALLAIGVSSRMPIWFIAQFVAVGALVMAVLVVWKHAPRAACLALLSLNFASGLLAVWAGAEAQSRLGDVSEPYHALVVSMLMVAILTPSVSLGAVWITAFSLLPIVETWTWPADFVRQLPTGEPWLSTAFGVAAMGILLYNRRSVRLARELSAVKGERLAAERVARMALSVRDLANTPLQTLTSGLSLLRMGQAPVAAVLDSMERALAKLSVLRRALGRFEQHLEWRPQDESFDSLCTLEEMASKASEPPPRR
jgi:hypothetical protein